MGKPKVIIESPAESVTVSVRFNRRTFRMWLALHSCDENYAEMEDALQLIFGDVDIAEGGSFPAFIERLTDTGERRQPDAKAE